MDGFLYRTDLVNTFHEAWFYLFNFRRDPQIEAHSRLAASSAALFPSVDNQIVNLLVTLCTLL